MLCCRKLNGPDFGPTSQERDVDAYQPTAPPLEENAEDCWRRAHQASPVVTPLFPNYCFPNVAIISGSPGLPHGNVPLSKFLFSVCGGIIWEAGSSLCFLFHSVICIQNLILIQKYGFGNHCCLPGSGSYWYHFLHTCFKGWLVYEDLFNGLLWQ